MTTAINTNRLTTSPAVNGSHSVKNHKSDLFNVKSFHHVEFWCSDAANAAGRFSWALGVPIVAKSDLSTGNLTHASYLLRSGHLSLVFSAPYSPSAAAGDGGAAIPTFDRESCHAFAASHGLAVRAMALEVDDADTAFRTSVAHGAKPVTASPVPLGDGVTLAEVLLYGDVVLRYIGYDDKDRNPAKSGFLPRFEPVQALISSTRSPLLDCGIRGLDHALVVVPELATAVEYVHGFSGFHEMEEFRAEDVGTEESGMNLVVLANDEDTVYLAVCEPVYGTKRKSAIETFVEHNEGGGLQHLALVSEDIFRTVREMRERSFVGGFEFMPSPPFTYYKNLKNRAGDVLSDEQIQQCEELGIMVDRDDEGTLLQIFTKPVGDRPTIFVEIIQRMVKGEEGNVNGQKGGHGGGFGKGNISELYKSLQEYEKSLHLQSQPQPTTTAIS